MIPPGYAILISAIAIIACLMLYARFFARSRKNSLPQPLDEGGNLDGGVNLDADSADAAVQKNADLRQSEDAHLFVLPADSMDSENQVEPSGFHSTTENTTETAESASDLVAKPNQRKDSSDSDYFDDLQEAAAGLAMLMRSSPVNKTSPVIFAPDESADVDEDAPGSIVLPLAASELEVSPEISTDEPVADNNTDDGDVTSKIPLVLLEGEELTAEQQTTVGESIEIEEGGRAETEIFEAVSGDHEATEPILPVDNTDETSDISLRDVNSLFDDSIELVDAEPAEVSESDPVAPESFESESPAPNRLRLLLGDEVGDTVDAIDEGLDELESLVVSIESSLASLDDMLFEENTLVSEAA